MWKRNFDQLPSAHALKLNPQPSHMPRQGIEPAIPHYGMSHKQLSRTGQGRMPGLLIPSLQVLRLHHTTPSKNCLMGAEHPDFSQVHAPIIPFDSQNIVRHAGRGTSLHFAESDMEAQAGGQQKTQVLVNWIVWFGFFNTKWWLFLSFISLAASQHLVLNHQTCL